MSHILLHVCIDISLPSNFDQCIVLFLTAGEIETSKIAMHTYPISRDNVVCNGLENAVQECSYDATMIVTRNDETLFFVNCSGRVNSEHGVVQ